VGIVSAVKKMELRLSSAKQVVEASSSAWPSGNQNDNKLHRSAVATRDDDEDIISMID